MRAPWLTLSLSVLGLAACGGAPSAPIEEPPAPERSPAEEAAELRRSFERSPNAGERLLRQASYRDADVESARVSCVAAVGAARGDDDDAYLTARDECLRRVDAVAAAHGLDPLTQPGGRPPEDFAPVADVFEHQGELAEGDSTVEQDGSYYDEYPVDLRAGWTVRISMESPTFDTYLWLIGPDGESIVQDDDGGEGTNSRIEHQVGESGRFTVRANSYAGDTTGPYTVRIEVLRP